MRTRRLLDKLVLGALILGASLTAGCKTYHYYDIDVKFMGGFSIADAGMIQFCQATVSGADSGSLAFPDNNTSTGMPICPIQNNYPDLGTFEYSTFEDSGTLHFVVSAYSTTSPQSGKCFAAGNTDIQATSSITTTGSLELSMTTSGCAQ